MSSTTVLAPDWPRARTNPDSCVASELIEHLAEADGRADEAGDWPDLLWKLVVECGATRWALPESFGGATCDRATLVTRYARLAEGSLTAAFILTQHDAAVRRLALGAGRETPSAAPRWLGEIAAARAFTTVGISQLTTSRRHGPQALLATAAEHGSFRLDGAMPWVTAAIRADVLVTGATTAAGQQLLIAMPADRRGVTIRPPFPLAALQASCTSEVICSGVDVTIADVLIGPCDDVMAAGGTAGTGGLETSALALGLARAALRALAAERVRREDLVEPIEALSAAWLRLATDLLAAADGHPEAPPPGQIRGCANALVLRATQAYLAARKGSGFLRTEPAQRWARQALFFLVWSCPAPVAQAAIRDLAGLCPA